MVQHSLPTKVLERLQDGNLFYPSAGDDIDTPIGVFSSWLSDFWFVDINYREDRPLRWNKRAYKRIHRERTIEHGITLKRRQEFEIEVFHETYERRLDQRRITTHQCKGRGYDAFRTFLKRQSGSPFCFLLSS